MKKYLQTRLDKINAFRASAGASLAVAGTSAFAAVPADVTTAMSDMKADALVVAGAFLVCAIAVTAFLYMRKGAR